jgi:small ubiquitin-related modifier
MSDETGEEVNETITLKVRDQSGEEMFFKVKKTTKLGKMMDAYAKRRGVPPNSLRFQLDGERLKSEDTPKMLELEENDQIDVMLEATGGSM